MNNELSQAIKHWKYVAPIVKYPHNEGEYDQLVHQLDELLTMVGNDEDHPVMSLVDMISDIIARYEAKRYATKNLGRGVDALKFLMELHQLSQNDLPEIGSQGVVSEILNGKRVLNLRQIKSLAARFGVDLTTFIDD